MEAVDDGNSEELDYEYVFEAVDDGNSEELDYEYVFEAVDDGNSEELDYEYVFVDLGDPYVVSLQKSSCVGSPKLDLEDSYDNVPNTLLPRCPNKKLYQRKEDYAKAKENVSIEDVVREHVLPFIPAKSLCRFKTVSREWDRWISTPFLAHKQSSCFKKISGLFCQFPGESSSFISLNPAAFGIPNPSLNFLPGPFEVRVTCNGLLCCQSHDGDRAYYICNPVTCEWGKLPRPNLYHGPRTAIALAFEPSTLNFSAAFELICAVPDHPVICFEIYSSRSNSWRVCNTVCCETDSLALNGDGFYLRGIVFWETLSKTILAFDLKNEEYGMLSLPDCSGSTGTLTEMLGELCYILPRKQFDEYRIEVYGNMDMKLKCEIPINPEVVGYTPDFCRALAFADNETLIVVLGSKVIAYHAKAQKMEELSNARNDGFAKYLPYVNNLAHVGLQKTWGEFHE